MKSAARRQSKPESGRASGARGPFFKSPSFKKEPVQAKLRVGRPGDKLEQEADHAADAVVHGRGPMAGGGAIAPRLSPIAQRMPEDDAERMEPEEVQASCERRSDPCYEAHEPALRIEPPVVEDEPLNMSPEDRALAMEEEAAQPQVEDDAQMVEEENAAQPRLEDDAQRMEEPEAQTCSERMSDPSYEAHEPARRVEPPVVEDEPLNMRAEDRAQTMEEEAGKAQVEENEAMTKEEPGSRTEDAQRREEAPPEADEAQRQTDEAQSETDEAQAQADEVQSRKESGRLSARATRLQVVERQLRAARGQGNPLPEAVRSKMEQGLGAEFSGVQIHTDAPAFLMTRLLRAKAFTSGKDIFFSPNRFAPGTTNGDHLLAHELAHTLQQGAVETHEDALTQRVAEDDRQFVRPESLAAIGIARGEIGKINSKLHGPDGNRVGWERLLEIFRGAYGGDVIPPAVVKRIITSPDQLPHWCGVFAWWALKKAGLPLPDWKSGHPMLQNTTQRPAGQLPQKGDIAYRTKLPWTEKLTHHQALVSGVESAETAEGKAFKSIKVRTVDGNTAGNDNLGGQVEEKWQPIGDWTAFFDPTGKLSLPDVPLVETDRASDDAGPVPEAVPEKDEGEAETPEAGETGAADVDAPPVVEPEGLPGPEDEVAVEPPPLVEAEPEPAAEVEKISLEGPSDKAMVGFIDAPASSMAASAPDLGPELDKKTTKEKKDVVAEAPVLSAKTGGEVDPGVTAPDELPVPADATLDDQGKGPEVGELTPDPYTTPGTAPSSKATREEMKRQPEGGFLDWIRNQFSNLMRGIKTTDDTVSTSAGPKQRVQLTGDADVGRMERQRQDGTAQLRTQRDEKVAAFKQHPGQSNIQPRKIDEDRTPAVTPETAEPIQALPPDEGVADFAAAELPANVRTAADTKMAPDLETNLAEARSETTAAAAKRDADKDAEIAEAERKTAEANKADDDGQRQAVLAGRTDVARQQGEAITGAYDGVAEFAGDAGKRQTDDQKKIGDNVKAEEGKADKALDDGEKEAERVKKEKEGEAAAKKAELKKKKEKQGLFDRAVGFVKDVVNRITQAIDDIFNALRSLVKKAIEAAKKAAITFINAARNAAIGLLNDFRDWAKDKVNKYVKDRFPGLANALNKGIDATVNVAIDGVNAAADAAIDTVTALADALGKALDRILAAFQAGLKAAVQIAGAVLTGDFAGALRIAIEAGCEIAGVDPKPIFDFMEKAGNQIKAILKSPGKFINNVMTAVGMGVSGFAERFGQHFKAGVIEWLTGALSAVPITLPDKWDIKGFFSLVAQILGLTYENIKARIIKKFPKAAKIFDLVEKGFALIKKLLSKDFSGLWEEVKAKLADLKQTIIAGIKNWVIVNVIKEGVIWLLSLLNPASALVKALKLLADLVFWLIDNFQQIKTFVMSVYTAISNIASGILGPAAKAVEDALARSLPVVISFVASAIGLGGIGEAVQGVIQKITKPINKMIDKLIDKVVAYAKKIWGKGKGAAKAIKEKLTKWWTEKKPFTSKDGGSHSLYYKGEWKKADLWVASTPRKLEDFLADKAENDSDDDQKKVAKAALKKYKKVLKTEGALDKLQAKKPPADEAGKKARRKKIDSLVLQLRNQLQEVATELAKANFKAKVAAQTQAKFTGGGKKRALALPLTHLPGNTKGSAPKKGQDPPGWDHAAALNDLEGKSGEWVRGHLLNDNLHGPGEEKNLVPITKTMNAQMEVGAEGPAKTAVKKKDKVLYYEATATFWGGSDVVKDFPKDVKVTWGEAKKSGSTYSKGGKLGGGTFSMGTRPPATVKTTAPSIESGSPSRIHAAIRKHNASVTSYFVSNVLIANSPYASRSNMRSRIYTKVRATLIAQGGAEAASKREKYVDATFNALKAKDLKV